MEEILKAILYLKTGAFLNVHALGKTLEIKKVSPGNYFLQCRIQSRWASNSQDLEEDIAHFQQTGELPKSKILF